MKIEKQIFGKQMWAEPCKDDEWDPVASDLLRPCPPVFFADVSGNRYIPETDLRSKFLGAIMGTVKIFFLSLLGLDCFQLEIICTLRRHFGVAKSAPPW